MLQQVLQAIASGVVSGCVYALIALSLVIIYKSTDVINFAGGEIVMLGGYLGLLALLYLGLPYAATFVFGALSPSRSAPSSTASCSTRCSGARCRGRASWSRW